MLCDALEAEGAKVREFRIKQLLTGNAPDVAHIHWPEAAISLVSMSDVRRACGRLFAGLRLAKLRGSRVVWTVHNAHPHERPHPELEPEFYSKLLRHVDGLIFLSETSRDQMAKAIDGLASLPSAVIPHGHYRPVLSGRVSGVEARKRLGIPPDAFLAAGIGAVRGYKNLPRLIEAFRAVSSDDEWLLVAGVCKSEALEREIRRAAESFSRVVLDLRLLDEDELEGYYRAADLAVTPYSAILNSGSLLYALSCGVPFFGPAQGSLAEVREKVGRDWVRLYEGEFDERVLRSGMDQAKTAPKGEPDLSDFEWGRIAKDTLAFYRSLLPASGPRKK